MKKTLCCFALCIAFSSPAVETNAIRLEDLALMAPEELKTMLHEAKSSADIYNAASHMLQDFIFAKDSNTNSYLQIIKDLNINFKVFDADTTGGDAGLGFSYAFDRALAGRTINPAAENPLGISFALHAKGNVAFDHKDNPDDFLESGGKIHLFQSIGGWEPMVNQELVPQVGADGKTNWITTTQVLINKLDLSMNEAQRATDPMWQEFFRFIDQNSKMQVLWDFAGNFALESNQSFSEKQYAYGAQAGLLLRAWNPTSPWARWNILDFPFAAIRFLTRADENWSPSGQALPSFVAGVDLISPTQDTARFTADPDEGTYPRFRGEVALKSRLTRWKENDIWVSMSYRRFQEIGPSDAIRAANLDATDYFAAQIDLVYGLNLSYSTGRLPFDHESDRVLAVGWKLNF
jgi:hypothetical protein